MEQLVYGYILSCLVSGYLYFLLQKAKAIGQDMVDSKSYNVNCIVDVSDASALEHYYVYRSLHSDESWGAVLSISSTGKLPNLDFGMHIYARNEKEAIGRARDIYERVHKLDSSRDNIKRFAAAARLPSPLPAL